MSPRFLADRIFQPFSQENPHAPGTGLGLSIVRNPMHDLYIGQILTSPSNIPGPPDYRHERWQG
jgi:signal transduction histidine kinase